MAKPKQQALTKVNNLKMQLKNYDMVWQKIMAVWRSNGLQQE